MTTQTTRITYTPERVTVADVAREYDRADLIPTVYFILAESVEARLEDTRDWIMIGGLLEAAGLALLAYLSDAPLIYALAAVALAVVAVGWLAIKWAARLSSKSKP